MLHSLTVKEHLWFYSNLKTGESPSEKEVDEMLKRMYMYEFKDCVPSGLSGGMKRKASIFIAFIGDSK